MRSMKIRYDTEMGSRDTESKTGFSLGKHDWGSGTAVTIGVLGPGRSVLPSAIQ